VLDNSGAQVGFASVTSGGNLLATTDSVGIAVLKLNAGATKITVFFTGFKPFDTVLQAPGANTITINLQPESSSLEEVVVVSSTRTGQSIESSPTKVEVLGQEELTEESTIKPGNIASLLGDVSGIQIQQTSATSGNSNVRIQGLDGKYTQILRDGMPLYQGFSGGFGILTIPPLDLKQIELIKGAASTLYGGGAIAGLINLVSRKPTFNQTIDAIVNYSSLGEMNANVFLSKRNNHFGYTLFAGYNQQEAKDVNNDGFSDVPKGQSAVWHPQFFYYPDDKTVISLGYNGIVDDRIGGNMHMFTGNAISYYPSWYFEENYSLRNTAEYNVEHTYSNNDKLTLKGNYSIFNRKVTSDVNEDIEGTQSSYYNELSLLMPLKKSTLVAGLNLSGDDYQSVQPTNDAFVGLNNLTAGAFAQFSWFLSDKANVEAGMRADKHNNGYGMFFLPRIAGIWHITDHWGARAGFGMGYRTPDPLEILDNDTASKYYFMMPSGKLLAERSYGYNAEINYKLKWGNDNSLFINQAFFLTQVQNPIFPQVIVFKTISYNPSITLINASTQTETKGSDTYAKLTIHSWELYLGYTYTIATNAAYKLSNSYIPLTPRNRMAFVLTKEIQKLWRFGLEGSLIGSQYRDDGSTTPSYFLMALMVQRNLGKHVTLVLNGENLLNYKMSNVEPLYTGPYYEPVFKPIWAPIDGRVVNLSVRWKLSE